jgi:3-deoxy-D-manno-octulosonic acid kinase
VTARVLPAGYERLAVGRAEAVAVAELVPLLRDVLAAGTLYDFARRQPDAETLMGRQPAYAIPTPAGDGRMVVRHNRHGGLLATLTGDRFLSPTRAPSELQASAQLLAAGVPTPQILAYVVYRTGPWARSDVATRMVDAASDLAARLAAADPDARQHDLDLTATLVAQISRAGARHHDLNAKNVLIGEGGAAAAAGGRGQALVLDVDRVTCWTPEVALAHNLRRLDRSLRKRRERFGEAVTDEEIAALARAAAERL